MLNSSMSRPAIDRQRGRIQARRAACAAVAALVLAGCATTRSGAPDVAAAPSRSAAAREEVKGFAVMYSPGDVNVTCGPPVVTDRGGDEVARYPCRAVTPGAPQTHPEAFTDHVACHVRQGTEAVRTRNCRAGVRDGHEHVLGYDYEARRTRPASGSCPKGVLEPDPNALEGVVHALRRAIPRIYEVAAMGHTQPLTPRTTDVLDVRSLREDGADLPGVRTFTGRSSYWGRLARRRCPAVASRSWMALVYFAGAPAVPFAYRYAFLARTAQGWIVWDHD
jgi:hypothetical protein